MPICKKPSSALLFLFFSISVFVCSCKAHSEKESASTESTVAGNEQQQKYADKNILAGNWVRTDAAYRIEITELSDDGNMKAAYLNPKSINVAKATWTNKDGFLKMYLELRDINYPGSNYLLSYIPGRDLLVGEYFQAAEKITYQVQFVRVK